MKSRHFMIVVSLVVSAIAMIGPSIPLQAGGDKIVIIANKSFKGSKMSKADVKRVFQKEKERISGMKVTPIHAKSSSGVRKAFNQKVLGMSVSKEETYWQQIKVQKGKLPPKELGNTLKAVSMVRGSVGYTFLSNLAGKEDSVKVLLKI
ncbi:MAG: hypothetical protein GY854_09345 [Deltaproteobacteria bacterium]|nr:hypothetical protein [Deltaproteobacteria bacterium]